ncbi:alpha/beta hydrolase [Paenibacillus sp. MER 180]|uniref:alpha/beta fold hydrolase n=1 Tax=Paenibacillus sp. MER 180 TaxID=2939570 RepID=UPI00203AB83E|nr:alpha/beta hydrolase [Paenibacillus sp. MER 180]MCM3291511.1 alpha/beta hydrolase [Paenibacillus sp. MER 180]
MARRTFDDLKSTYYEAYDRTLTLWNTPFTSVELETHFGRTHVIASGSEDAPPLVLLHAHEFSSTMWYRNSLELSKHFRIYAVDIIGDKNKTLVTRFPNSREEYAQWLCEVLDALHIERADIVGISFGALLALNLAIHFPERVGRAIIMSPSSGLVGLSGKFIAKIICNSLISTRRQFVSKLFRWNQHESHTHFFEQVVAGALWRKPHPNVKAGKRVWPHVFKDEELNTITCPLLIMLGEQDITQNPQAAMAKARSCLPSAVMEMLPGVGHFFNLQIPEIVNERVISFMKDDNPASKGDVRH